MTTRLQVFTQHLSRRFSSDAAAIDAALDINPTGPTQTVFLHRGEDTFIKALVPHGIHVWHIQDSPFYCFAPADNAENMTARDKLTREPEPATDAGKLAALIDSWGLEDENDLAQEALFDSVAPGICMNPECDYTTEVEPDQDAGNCEHCNTNTVKSGLSLMGVI